MKIIHIAQGTPCSCGAQDGSPNNPFRASTTDPDSFDRIFAAHREPTAFILWPGVYQTRGAWAFDEHDYAMLGPNSSLVGVGGSSVTKIKLAEDYTNTVNGHQALYLETIITGGPNAVGSEAAAVTGITIDASTARLPVIGLHVFSSGARIADVRVHGIKGVWGGYEGFGILVNDGKGSRGGGSTVNDCSVSVAQTPDTYVTGIYLGSLAVRGQPNSIVSCYVTAPVNQNRRAHSAYAANENTLVTNCVGNGFERFIFSDTSNAGDLEITGCRGDFAYCAVDYPCNPSEGNPITYRRRIRVANCTFTNNHPTSDHAILLLLQDQSPDHDKVDISDVDVDGVRVSSALPPGKFYACSIQAAKASKVWIRNSSFPPGAITMNGVYPPTPLGAVTIDGNMA